MVLYLMYYVISIQFFHSLCTLKNNGLFRIVFNFALIMFYNIKFMFDVLCDTQCTIYPIVKDHRPVSIAVIMNENVSDRGVR